MSFEVDEKLTKLLKDKKIVAVAGHPLSMCYEEYEIDSELRKGTEFTFIDGEVYVIFSDGTALKIRWPSSGYMEYIEEYRNDNEVKKLISEITKKEDIQTT